MEINISQSKLYAASYTSNVINAYNNPISWVTLEKREHSDAEILLNTTQYFTVCNETHIFGLTFEPICLTQRPILF